METRVTRCCTTILRLCLGAVPLQVALAQQPAPEQPGRMAAGTGQTAVADTTLDRSRIESYVRVLKSELERSEARVSSATTNLLVLDRDIEARVSQIVALLSSVRDSADGPGSRMRKAKEDAIEGLKATAAYYAQERDRRTREMATGFARIDEDALARDVAALNARIETRVTQSLDLASSLVQHDEGAVRRYDDDDRFSRETDEFRKRQRDANASAKIKADLVDDLRASIAKLTRDAQSREADIRATRDEQKRARYAREIEGLRKVIQARHDQIAELLTAENPATRPIGSKGAFEMDQMIDEMTQELRRDFVRFKTLVGERDDARARVKPLLDRLERANAALAAMTDADAGGAAVPAAGDGAAK